MKRTIVIGLAAAGLLSSLAIAQPGRSPGDCPPGQPGIGPMSGMGQGGSATRAGMRFDPAARAAQRLEALQAQLKLTPEQQPLWLAFVELAQGEAVKGRAAMHAQMADDKLTAPERMAQMQAQMQARLAAMEGVNASFGRLYDALTPEQKAIADRHAARLGGPGRRGPQGGRGTQG